MAKTNRPIKGILAELIKADLEKKLVGIELIPIGDETGGVVQRVVYSCTEGISLEVKKGNFNHYVYSKDFDKYNVEEHVKLTFR